MVFSENIAIFPFNIIDINIEWKLGHMSIDEIWQHQEAFPKVRGKVVGTFRPAQEKYSSHNTNKYQGQGGVGYYLNGVRE